MFFIWFLEQVFINTEVRGILLFLAFHTMKNTLKCSLRYFKSVVSFILACLMVSIKLLN